MLINPRGLPKLKTLVEDNRAPPVQNTWYTAIDVSGNIIVQCVDLFQTNDEVANKDVDVKITIDGQVIENVIKAFTSAIRYTWMIQVHDGALSLIQVGDDTNRVLFGFTDASIEATFHFNRPFSCQAFKLEYRITSAPGTNQVLHSDITYQGD